MCFKLFEDVDFLLNLELLLIYLKLFAEIMYVADYCLEHFSCLYFSFVSHKNLRFQSLMAAIYDELDFILYHFKIFHQDYII